MHASTGVRVAGSGRKEPLDSVQTRGGPNAFRLVPAAEEWRLLPAWMARHFCACQPQSAKTNSTTIIGTRQRKSTIYCGGVAAGHKFR